MSGRSKLIRKQFLVSSENIEKMEKIAADRGTSVAEVVRQAIEAYDTESADEMATMDLMELVSSRLREAIADTRMANEKVERLLKSVTAVET